MSVSVETDTSIYEAAIIFYAKKQNVRKLSLVCFWGERAKATGETRLGVETVKTNV